MKWNRFGLCILGHVL